MAEWWNDENLVKQVYEEAEQGNTAAQCELGRQMMREGRMKEAISWYKRAAAAGTADAMFNLGLIYAQGWQGESPSLEQAFFWFERAANAGDAEGMYMTGNYLLHGIGTEQNVEQAAQWLSGSLSAGYLAAQELLFTIPGMKEERETKLQEIEELAAQTEKLLEQKEYVQAIPLLQKAVAESSAKLGETDACTINLMNNLAVALSAMKQYQQCIPLKERVLELRGKSLPVNHPDYITAVTNLTSDYAKVGRYQSAINLSKQAYTAARESFPASHEITLLAVNRLASDFISLCRHDLAYEQLKAVKDQAMAEMSGTVVPSDKNEDIQTDDRENTFTSQAKEQWECTLNLLQTCETAQKENEIFFSLDEGRRSYAYICAELCEMLDGLPEEYRSKIKTEEYEHYKEQAALAGCYQPHLNSGQAVETDPYTNALQTLVSLKYLMPGIGECREELDGIQCRAIVTWIQNELCVVVTVYPVKSIVEYMEHPQPADFVKSLNACAEPGERVLSIDSLDLQMRRMKNGQIQISFAYGTEGTYRMIRMHYNEANNQLEGESQFIDLK